MTGKDQFCPEFEKDRTTWLRATATRSEPRCRLLHGALFQPADLLWQVEGRLFFSVFSPHEVRGAGCPCEKPASFWKRWTAGWPRRTCRRCTGTEWSNAWRMQPSLPRPDSAARPDTTSPPRARSARIWTEDYADVMEAPQPKKPPAGRGTSLGRSTPERLHDAAKHVEASRLASMLEDGRCYCRRAQPWGDAEVVMGTTQRGQARRGPREDASVPAGDPIKVLRDVSWIGGSARGREQFRRCRYDRQHHLMFSRDRVSLLPG